MKAALVVTTVNDLVVLNDYYLNFERYGHLSDVEVLVIGDRKTPAVAEQTCHDFQNRGLKVEFMTLAVQEEFLRRLALPTTFVPYDSDNRRNIGFLIAYERGSDFLISIDDDNYALQSDDFFEGHSIVCADPRDHDSVSSSSGWYDICRELTRNPAAANSYARGFPYFARHSRSELKMTLQRKRVAVNAGLWLNEPDMDAITWLVSPARIEAFSGKSIVLAETTWSPINTQNTALRMDAVVAYYFVRMGYNFGGGIIDRYGDIYSGFFLEACAHHLGEGIRFGSPIVEHRRNSHNYLRDAIQELGCIAVNEELLAWLSGAKLEGGDFIDSYLCLSHLMEDAVEGFHGVGWNDSVRGYFHQAAYHMRQWLAACRMIRGRY